MEQRGRILVLGAGLAGAACAWALARSRCSLVVLEREPAAGRHATAQNAAMVRSLVDEDGWSELALAGARFWNSPPPELASEGLFRRSGSLLLAEGEAAWALLERRVHEARDWAEAHGDGAAFVPPELWSPERCRELVPVLRDCPLRGGAYSPSDGIADPALLVERCLHAAQAQGASVRCEAEVQRLLVEEGAVRGVELAGGERLHADAIVLAAGAWASSLLEASGLPGRELVPHRRHLFATSAWSGLATDAPFVWHIDGGVYFRPESGGVLFSVCDQAAVAPGQPALDERVLVDAAARLARLVPFLEELPIAHAWAGLRTFDSSGAPRLGRDPDLPGLHYAAGLGGHGVTCAGPIGLRVAESLRPEAWPDTDRR